MIRLLLVHCCLCLSGGCAFLPEIARQPTVHNPFPQLTTVAVAPFINLSTEPTIDGRQVALAYFNELQSIPGFEVIPIGVVEKKLEEYRIALASPDEARQVAQLLGADAVVVGAVTDFSPYYPPRLALQVEWYAANPCYHPIPAGYGLPWGTPAESEIPGPLIFEAEMALARAQLKTQTPSYPQIAPLVPPPADPAGPSAAPPVRPGQPHRRPGRQLAAVSSVPDAPAAAGPPGAPATLPATGPAAVAIDPFVTTGPGVGLPPDWPDPRGFTPPLPAPSAPACIGTGEPVLRHTRTYNGHDADLTAALSTYVYFRDDARYGGWQSYLQRSDDFIRFCCHMHIAEMLSARGGAGETRVVWRWPTDR